MLAGGAGQEGLVDRFAIGRCDPKRPGPPRRRRWGGPSGGRSPSGGSRSAGTASAWYRSRFAGSGAKTPGGGSYHGVRKCSSAGDRLFSGGGRSAAWHAVSATPGVIVAPWRSSQASAGVTLPDARPNHPRRRTSIRPLIIRIVRVCRPLFVSRLPLLVSRGGGKSGFRCTLFYLQNLFERPCAGIPPSAHGPSLPWRRSKPPPGLVDRPRHAFHQLDKVVLQRREQLLRRLSSTLAAIPSATFPNRTRSLGPASNPSIATHFTPTPQPAPVKIGTPGRFHKRFRIAFWRPLSGVPSPSTATGKSHPTFVLCPPSWASAPSKADSTSLANLSRVNPGTVPAFPQAIPSASRPRSIRSLPAGQANPGDLDNRRPRPYPPTSR